VNKVVVVVVCKNLFKQAHRHHRHHFTRFPRQNIYEMSNLVAASDLNFITAVLSTCLFKGL